MPPTDAHNIHDAAAQSAQPEPSAHLQKDTGFNQVGDASGNQAWSQMTGASTRSSDSALTGAAGGVSDTQRGAINFLDHGDIYNQNDTNSHRGLTAGGQGAGGDQSAGRSLDISTPTGGDQGRSLDASPPTAVPTAAPSDSSSPTKAPESGSFDSNTASYDGNRFYQPTDAQTASLPTEVLERISSNNYEHLQNRTAALGGNMPDVVMRGVSRPGVHDMEVLAQQKAGQYSQDSGGSNWFAVSTERPGSAKETIDHLASHFSRARGYANQGSDGASVYAFAHKGGSSEPRMSIWTEMVGAPFSETQASGESRLKFDSANFAHLATFSGADAAPNSHPSLRREESLNALQTLKNINRIISNIEAAPDAY